jgi:hypothetical protein
MAIASIATWAVFTVLVFGWISFGSRGGSRERLDRMAV